MKLYVLYENSVFCSLIFSFRFENLSFCKYLNYAAMFMFKLNSVHFHINNNFSIQNCSCGHFPVDILCMSSRNFSSTRFSLIWREAKCGDVPDRTVLVQIHQEFLS